MSETMTNDVIDKVLRLENHTDLLALRNRREKLKALTQSSYIAALTPKDPGNFSYAFRAALSVRICKLWKADELVDHYRELLAGYEQPELAPITETNWRPGAADVVLDAILERSDLVTLSPKNATHDDVTKLFHVGLDDKDIVALASLVAFVNYQVLVVAGLRMLRDH